MTPGQEALAEAARLEAALVYGRVQHEHRQPGGIAALVAEAELEARAQHVDKPARPVRSKRVSGKKARSDAADSPTSTDRRYPQDELVLMAVQAAMRAGLTNHEVMAAYCVDYAHVRAARKRLMAGAA